MIFSVGNHIQQIISGEKTQTRRRWDGYQVGNTYSIQPGRNEPGIPDGRILIIDKMEEWRLDEAIISESDAQAEGGYTPEQFEELYIRMDKRWSLRYAHTFIFVPTEEGEE